MTLRELATCPATTCAPTATVRDAARLMAEAEVGFLVVVEEDRPVGVLTDRDIVLRAVATGRDTGTPVRDVMTHHAAHIDEGATVEEAATLMADKQCRRLALTTGDRRVVGVLSLDDLVREAGVELQQVARAVRGSRHGHQTIP